ncbi:phenylalanyl-tRNA synthetase [Wallemia mellicola]|uniref:Phenylalanine--tRNA ligase beta subunit n=1 Tax=Wallemia mellicola TaxID=1708541 RepID=A0AB38MLP1_9BASI|nr:phenylalanyl-tRNA synthetase [Wallemia mellicola]TIB88586.1 phenylalanyl-tRNA synthetase [Wallemia mellicola]TIC40768.1 phenylalanyl-tRNA synthetase [Wallemia mellicola]TIC49338.1 phenylalanyl-tRNA synthetase [Wallemia mellicola]TIC66223.1 phenylalanyl-tRNA synthetase [Wallemia mellicola]
MPTISVDKAELFKRLGREYTTKEFDELCFEFGIELDEDTTEEVLELQKQGQQTEAPQLKIEIPANRYDLLCIEGIARALNVFLGRADPPAYKPADTQNRRQLKVTGETKDVRPYAAAAILRGVKFTEESYASFIDLQDKLHNNLCRKRQFVAIGTHDYDTVASDGPFTYEGRKPENIHFVPLNKDKEVDGNGVMELYSQDKHIGKFLHLIDKSPVYPTIYDSNGTLLSLPPLINGDHSKIKISTTNVFIECTATDATKLDMVLDIMCAMFSEYTEKPFEIEQVEVINPDNSKRLTPVLDKRVMKARSTYINSCTGLSSSAADLTKLLTKMGLPSKPSGETEYDLLVEIPITRPDILHECDIMEDAAIAFGFNKLPRTFPTAYTVAAPLPINKLSDIIRKETAMAGWTEVLPLILCSRDENCQYLNKDESELKKAVHLENPKTLEYQVVRTSLLPGLLKTIRENKHHALPIKVFETSDIAFVDTSLERKSKNQRRVAAIYNDKKGSFEVAHGLLDRLLNMLGIEFLPSTTRRGAEKGYYIVESDDKTYFPGRAASIVYRPPPTHKEPESTFDNLKSKLTEALPDGLKDLVESRDRVIGTLGILHPEVLEKFEIKNPCSAFEFNLEEFL